MSSNGVPSCRSTLRGKITCILGPMFSGKTTELLRMHDRQIIAKRKCVLVKYAGDTRYDPELVARISTKFTDCAETCDRLASVGKVVYVAALSGTFERKTQPSRPVSLLLPYADEIKQVVAVCMGCGSDASYSFRNTLDKKVTLFYNFWAILRGFERWSTTLGFFFFLVPFSLLQIVEWSRQRGTL
ncbi:thymidine kinase [Cooperia oncophora]